MTSLNMRNMRIVRESPNGPDIARTIYPVPSTHTTQDGRELSTHSPEGLGAYIKDYSEKHAGPFSVEIYDNKGPNALKDADAIFNTDFRRGKPDMARLTESQINSAVRGLLLNLDTTQAIPKAEIDARSPIGAFTTNIEATPTQGSRSKHPSSIKPSF